MRYILNLNKKTKITIFLVIIMLISAFLFILLFSKDHKLLSTNSVIAYQCDYGWTKVGDGPTAYCQKSNGYTYKCSRGKLVGPSYDPSCQVCETKYRCDYGYRKVIGKGQPEHCEKEITTYYCPNGKKPEKRNGKYVCREQTTFTCPKGYFRDSSKGQPRCIQFFMYRYSCPSGTTKVGDGPGAYCIKGKGRSQKMISTIKRPHILEMKSATEKKKYVPVKAIRYPTYLTKALIPVKNYSDAKTKTYKHPKSLIQYQDCTSPTKAYLKKQTRYAYSNTKAFSGSGTLSYTQSYTSGNATASVGFNYSEPDPSVAINLWKDKLNTNNFVYPKDSVTGKSLGAWPKNYKNYPAQLNNPRTYTGGYMWPITTTDGPYKFGYDHNGIDIAVKFGTPVYSPVSGTLVYSEWGHTVNRGTDETSYSITIRADSVNYRGKQIGEVFLTHLSGIRYRCAENKCNRSVKQGELLGFSGTAAGNTINSGYARGKKWASHLHMSLSPANNYNAGLHTEEIEDFYKIESGDYRDAGR